MVLKITGTNLHDAGSNKASMMKLFEASRAYGRPVALRPIHRRSAAFAEARGRARHNDASKPPLHGKTPRRV